MNPREEIDLLVRFTTQLLGRALGKRDIESVITIYQQLYTGGQPPPATLSSRSSTVPGMGGRRSGAAASGQRRTA